MADTETITFGDLYKYNTTKGVVIPQTSDVKAKIEHALKQVFNSDDFSTDPTTANGRLIEALTLLFIDVCGINAQNIGALNIESAFGTFLDNLGANWGVFRNPGETDNAYRQRILGSFSRGSGFVQSIKNAIAKVQGVTIATVLENGSANPAMRPLSLTGERLSNSISVAPNSVAIFVLGGSETDIANAIVSTKSCGCGYTRKIDYGTPVKSTFSMNGTTEDIYFYRPTPRYIKIDVTVNDDVYFGENSKTETKTIISDLLNENITNTVITKNAIESAIARNSNALIAESITIRASDADATLNTSFEVDEIVLPPYKYLVFDIANITVTNV